MDVGETTTSKRATSPSTLISSRPKRPKTSKACNACRKQKSRCERLAGDSEGCHRCSVIGIPCVFDTEPISTDITKTRRPRPILPKNSKVSPIIEPSGAPVLTSTVNGRHQSPDNSRLHVLANTTEMLSRAAISASVTSSTSLNRPAQPVVPVASTPKTPLSPETLSNVESTLFPFPGDLTQECEFARLHSDWKRWIAPLTLVQNLVRRNAPSESDTALRKGLSGGMNQDSPSLSPLDEARLKKHFLHHYAPWLPVVRLGRNGSLENISPFLSTVILATASRTLAGISHPCVQRLRELALNYVGQIFANPTSYPLIESLYALLILVLWPLDPADDVELLVHGAKRMASAGGKFSKLGLPNNASNNRDSTEDDILDLTRLWYAICANETILTLGAGSVAPSPPSDTFIHALEVTVNTIPIGGPSAIASAGGNAADIVLTLQTNLHGIITAAMGERGISAVSSISLNDGAKKFPFDKERDKEKIGQAVPRTRDAWLSFIGIVYLYLTRLGEWEIEFGTIAGEALPSASHIYTILEIEYHYLCMIFVTHCALTLCHACPLTSAPDEIKYALWSWCITGNKSAHAIIKLFNQYSTPVNVPQDREEQTACCRGRLAVFSSAPDRLYAMVVLAVMLVLRHQVASSEYGHKRGPGESPPAGFTKQAEIAIRRVVSRMTELGQLRVCELPSTSSCTHDKPGSPNELRYDHSASRYVDILDALVRIWEEKRAMKAAGMAPRGCHPCSSFNTHVESRASSASGQYSTTSIPSPYPHHATASTTSQLPQQQQHQPVHLDLNLLGTDLFSDAAAAFTWDSLGTIDWSTMSGMGGI